MKVATLVLEYSAMGWIEGKNYRVETVTNSVEYNPGDFLAKAEVGVLCNSTAWKITIKGIAARR